MSKRKHTSSAKGVVGEYSIALNFTKKGYYVFMAIDPQSPADMVVLSPKGKLQAYDIKTKTYRKKDYVSKTDGYKRNTTGSAISRAPTKLQKKLKIKLLMTDF